MKGRRNILNVGVAVLMLLLTTSSAVAMLSLSPAARGQAPGPIDQTWVDQQLVAWQPSVITPMSFGAEDLKASYDNPLLSYNSMQVQSSYLNMLNSTGAQFVRIDVGYDPWLSGNSTAQNEMATLIGQARSDGKGIIIADASAERYRSNPLPWAQFQTAWVQRVQTLASLFHPDYYIVIKEPGWYAPMISDVLTNPAAQSPDSWLNLTAALTSAVHSVSPDTKVGVAIAADSLSSNPSLYDPYLKGLAGMGEISFIGFDIYTITGFTATQNYLNTYGSGSKDVWIAECWSSDGTNVNVYDPSRAALDATWVQAAYYFAEQVHATMMIPFYGNIFASYNLSQQSPSDPGQIVSLLQERTPVFYSFQNVISTNAAGTLPTYTTTTSQTATSQTSTSGTSAQTSGEATTGSISTSASSTGEGGGGSGAFGGRAVLLGAAIAVVVVLAVVGLWAARRGRAGRPAQS